MLRSRSEKACLRRFRGKFEGRPFRAATINSLGAGGVKSKAPFPGFSARGDNNEVLGVFSFSFPFPFFFLLRATRASNQPADQREPTRALPIVFRNFKAFLGHLQRRLPFSGRFPPSRSSARAKPPFDRWKETSPPFSIRRLRGDKQTRFHDCGIRRFDPVLPL